MSKIISVHEYELRPGISGATFESAIKRSYYKGLLNLPGLIKIQFLRCIRSTRQIQYAAIWTYESKEAWENLWGKVDQPKLKHDYPDNWKIWEVEILAPLITCEPDRINYTAYEEVSL